MPHTFRLHRWHTGLFILCAMFICGSAQAEVYNFKLSSGAQRIPVITHAGSYIFVEVLQDPKSANTILFKFSSTIPQPVSSICRLLFDSGADKTLFASMSIQQESGTKMVPSRPMPHPYTGTLKPNFAFKSSGTGLYNPNSIQPGDMVTIAAMLGPERSFAHVIKALEQGNSTNADEAKNGLRLGVFVYHLLGKRPNPKKTIMDDGGYLTSGLVVVEK